MQEKIRPGYRQTDVGVIPEDWDVVPIGGLGEVRTGGTPPTNRRELYGGGYLFVSPADIGANKYINRTEKTLSLEGFRSSRIFPAGSSLFVCIGSTIGKVGLAAVDLCSNQQINSVSPEANVDSEFLFYSLVHASPRIAALAGEQAVPIINKSAFSANLIALPGKDEQRAIAEALSDADARILTLETLIAKKRDLKQASMQQLLTGKTRLPGFSGDWEAKRLGDLGSTYGGLTGKSKVDFGHGSAKYIPFMNVMTNVVVDLNSLEKVDVRPGESQNQARAGDLFFNGSSETPEEVGMCALLAENVEDLYLNSFCFGFRLKSDAAANGLFLAGYFRSQQGRDLLASLAQGATRYNLSKRALLKVEFACPSLDEQVAIAEILSDMDAEIAALEAEAEKARGIKQGMMQNLLTGKVRLV